MAKKYVSLSKLSFFLDNLKTIFSPLIHTHKISDISDYVVDSELSPTSTNPIQNKVLDAELNAMADAMPVSHRNDPIPRGNNLLQAQRNMRQG